MHGCTENSGRRSTRRPMRWRRWQGGPSSDRVLRRGPRSERGRRRIRVVATHAVARSMRTAVARTDPRGSTSDSGKSAGRARPHSHEQGFVPRGDLGRSPAQQGLADAAKPGREREADPDLEPGERHGSSSPNHTRLGKPGSVPRSWWERKPGSGGRDPSETRMANPILVSEPFQLVGPKGLVANDDGVLGVERPLPESRVPGVVRRSRRAGARRRAEVKPARRPSASGQRG